MKGNKLTAALAAGIMIVGLSATPAHATSNIQPTSQSTQTIASTAQTTSKLSKELPALADEAVATARDEDPQGFKERVNMVLATDAFEELPSHASLGDRVSDAEVFAAAVDDKLALSGLLQMISDGVITSERAEDGSTYWDVDEDALSENLAEPSENSSGVVAMAAPQCPAAWAAALTWISLNAGKCALFGPQAAVACAIGYGIAGQFIEFNKSC